MLPGIDQLKAKIEAAVPNARIEVIPNDTPAAQLVPSWSAGDALFRDPRVSCATIRN
jgi:TusA-related sulfurtransferase